LSLSSKGKAAKAIMKGSIPKEILFTLSNKQRGIEPLIAEVSGDNVQIDIRRRSSPQLWWPALLNGGRIVFIEL
jgi:hypothetical protein